MARFRRGPAQNWENRTWRTSPALNALMDEIEEAYPAQHKGDGTVASENHDDDNPLSDHRPWPYTGPGVVNAVDAGENVENDGWVLAEAIRRSRDPRVRYVQHEGAIFSSYARPQRRAWEWGAVGGNPHVDHVHVSVLREKQNDARPWDLGLGDDMSQYGPENWDTADFKVLGDFYQGTPSTNSPFQLALHGTLVGKSGQTFAAHLQKILVNTNLLIGSVADDEDIELLIGLIKELPTDVVDEIARRLALPGPR